MICPKCGGDSTGNFCIYCGAEMPNSTASVQNKNSATRTVVTTKVEPAPARTPLRPPLIPSDKNRLVALILCMFFGYFGGHHFYAGRVGMGVLYICTCGLFGIGTFIDIVLIACGAFKDADGLYIVTWMQ